MFRDQDSMKVDIPPVFKTEEGAHFKECISCSANLLQNEEPYMIERAIKKYPAFNIESTIFEYAICLKCAEKMRKTLSRESLQRMEKHFMENANWASKMELLNQEEPATVDDFVEDCIFSGKKRSDNDLDEYQVFAYCQGDKLILSRPPFMISNLAAEAMSELLSKQTRDELDGFIDENFGLPPEWKKALKDRDTVLI